jgi:polyhydroxyalkanoate synthase subunit PhaC
VQGKLLDELGLGPIETPSRVLLSAPLVTLKAYGEPHPGPVLLIVPAPIKRAYIWDLVPGASVVQRLLASGIQVYLMEWERPGAGARHGTRRVC